METKRLEFKQADGCEFIARIAMIGGPPDSDNDIIEPGAFRNARKVAVLPAHDSTHHAIGFARIEERGNEALAIGEFNVDTEAGRDWCSTVKFDLEDGNPVQEWSFGFFTRDFFVDDQGVRHLTHLDVMEVSPVLRGAGVDTGTQCAGECGGKLAKSCCDSCANGGDCEDDLDPELEAAIAARVAIANEVREAKEKRLVRYKYVDPLPWKTWIWEIGEDLADAASIAKPTIRLMEEARDDEAADFTYKRDPGGRTLCGLASPGEHTIRLLNGQSVDATLKTLAHEIGHLVLHRRGKRQSEQVCNAIGVKVKKSLISNARRSETYWMREAMLA